MTNASSTSGARSTNDLSLSSAQASLAIATLLWAGNFIVGRALRHDMAPLELNFWRWLIALAVLLPFNFRVVWLKRGILAHHMGFVAFLALTGVVVPHTCVYVALGTTNVVNALLLMSFAPLLISLGDWVFFHESMGTRQWLGMAVACTGAVILIARGDADILLTLQASRGDLWMVVAVFSVAAQALLLKRTPSGLSQAHLLTASVVAALIMMLPLILLSGGLSVPSSDFKVAASLLYIGVFASAAAFLLWNRGVAKLGPGRAAPFLYLMPLYGSVLAGVLLSEMVQPFQGVGGSLVFLGLWVARRR